MNIPVDRYIQLGSVRTRYWTEGEGPPVILIHGISNSIEDWLLNIHAIAGHYRAYALDLIGHGRTDKPLSSSYQFADFARFVKEFLDALAIPSAHLIGHSLGGAVTLTLARLYPSYINKIVLVDSAGLAQQCAPILRLVSVPGLGELMGAMFMQGDLAKRMAMQRKSWPDPQVVPDEMIRLKYEATRWEDIRRTYFKSLRASANLWGMKKGAYEPIVQSLSSLRNPLLVVWGENDDLVPVSHVQIVKDRVQQARIEIFENCKHDPMIVNPSRFNQLVLDFLKD